MIAHQAAEEPNVEDLEKDVFDGPALRVRYRIVEGLIPVKRDRTQVENGGRAAEDVEGEPRLADEAAEHPP